MKRQRDIQEEILEKSIELFLAKSYAATSVREITEAVNIGKGTFYWYFKSKEDLLIAIADRFEKVFLEGLIERIKGIEGGFEEKFKEYHRFGSKVASQERELSIVFTTLSAELSGSGSKAERRMKEIYERYHGFVKGLLEEGRKEGKVREDLDLDVASHVIIGLHDGVFLEWYRNYGKVEGKSLAKTFREIVFKGLLKE